MTTNEELIAEARMHAFTIGPNMGICAADGVVDSSLGRVLVDECQLRDRLADALAAVPAPTYTDAEKDDALFTIMAAQFRDDVEYDGSEVLERIAEIAGIIASGDILHVDVTDPENGTQYYGMTLTALHRTPVPAPKTQDGEARDERDAKFFHDGWVAALKEVRKRGDRAVGEFLVEQLGEPVSPEGGETK